MLFFYSFITHKHHIKANVNNTEIDAKSIFFLVIHIKSSPLAYLFLFCIKEDFSEKENLLFDRNKNMIKLKKGSAFFLFYSFFFCVNVFKILIITKLYNNY